MKTQITKIKDNLSISLIIFGIMLISFTNSGLLSKTEIQNQVPDVSGTNLNVIETNNTIVQINAIVDGLYNPLTGSMEKSPSVKVSLRNTSPPFETVYTAKGILDKNTFSGTFIFPDLLTGRYYIVLKFNNSNETWSRDGGELFIKGEKVIFDFTSGKDKAFGGNMEYDGKYAYIYTGDVDQDGFISRNDINFVTKDLGERGDLLTDLNGDEFVDASDVSIVMNNYEKKVKTFSPETFDVTILELKLMIDGICDHSNDKMNKSPFVNVFLRNAEPPYEIISKSDGYIFGNNLEGVFYFPNLEKGNYYIVVKYNNSIETWSRNGGETIGKNKIVKYDFTTGKDKAYGENMEYDGKFACIFTGDVDQDNVVSESDVKIVTNDIGKEGELNTDLNGDEFVDATDLNFVMNNYEKNVKARTPLVDNDQISNKIDSKESFTLNQNSPNPFNPTTRITFSIPTNSNVEMSVYDINGQEIIQLVNSVLTSGNYTYEWNASSFSSGTYFCRLNVNGVEKITKMMLIK